MKKQNTTNSLKRAAIFTDIHFGKKANSHIHNQDCTDFVDWFCDQVKQDGKIDHIMFLGDWFENRSAINIATMKIAYENAKKLNSLGIPIYFIVGNHDLYHRHTREIHSLINYQEFDNFILISEPTIIDETPTPVLMSPFLFHSEYDDLKQHLDKKFWFGHFEFKGFEVTGAGMRMPTGPEAKDYVGPKYIFSGHFHKRQANEQIVYIGNAFPMDFGDAGDGGRGMMVFDYDEENGSFINWDECPMYVKTTLSAILDDQVEIPEQSRVKCIVDIPIDFKESTYLKEKFLEDFNLREISIEESSEMSESLANTETDVDVHDQLASVHELVLQMLNDIDNEQIDNSLLVNCYNNLKN